MKITLGGGAGRQTRVLESSLPCRLFCAINRVKKMAQTQYLNYISSVSQKMYVYLTKCERVSRPPLDPPELAPTQLFPRLIRPLPQVGANVAVPTSGSAPPPSWRERGCSHVWFGPSPELARTWLFPRLVPPLPQVGANVAVPTSGSAPPLSWRERGCSHVWFGPSPELARTWLFPRRLGRNFDESSVTKTKRLFASLCEQFVHQRCSCEARFTSGTSLGTSDVGDDAFDATGTTYG